MQTDPGDTIKAYRLMKRQGDPKKCFIKGKRHSRPLIEKFFEVSTSIIETIVLRKVLYDVYAQPNLFHRDFINNIRNPPLDFSFDIYFYYVAKKLGYKILKFPVLFPKRIYGESHWNTGIEAKWKFLKKTVKASSEMRK